MLTGHILVAGENGSQKWVPAEEIIRRQKVYAVLDKLSLTEICDALKIAECYVNLKPICEHATSRIKQENSRQNIAVAAQNAVLAAHT